MHFFTANKNIFVWLTIEVIMLVIVYFKFV